MKNKLGKLIFSILLCEVVGGIGSLFTSPAINGWYETLEKPFFNPPNWIFAPVWTFLFLLMGIAFYLVFISPEKKGKAILAFSVQLFLNVLWSFLFFGLRSPFFALLEIIVLWLAIFVTIKKFSLINRVAALALLPYLIWVSFATVLNFSIWMLNF
ncbi:MAG: TspO/MBR family protein [bacterium]